MSGFRNFAGTVASAPHTRQSISTLEQLAQALDAAARHGHGVRTVGAGHSFTALCRTDQVLLDLDGFSGIEEVDAATHEVTFRAGTRLWQIPRLLKPFGLALENMGDIDKQSIAGAISTGTHGTGLDYTGFAGTVTGIQLMLADGTRLRTSRSEHPQIFEAARLSLGALGVITHVRLRSVPAYMMRAVESIEPVDQLVDSFLQRAAAEDHLEFFWFPNSPRAQVKTNTRLPGGAPRHAPGAAARWFNDELLSNGALQVLCSLGAAAPKLNSKLSNFASSVLSDRSYTASWHEAFASPRRVRFTEQEYALPLENFQAAFEQLRGYLRGINLPVLFPIEVRTAKADDVWLSTAYGRDSVYIAVHRYIRDAAPHYFSDVEALLRPLGGRPHWGKEHSLGAADFAQLYPRFADFQSVRSAVDPEGRFLNGYLRGLLGA